MSVRHFIMKQYYVEFVHFKDHPPALFKLDGSLVMIAHSIDIFV